MRTNHGVDQLGYTALLSNTFLRKIKHVDVLTEVAGEWCVVAALFVGKHERQVRGMVDMIGSSQCRGRGVGRVEVDRASAVRRGSLAVVRPAEDGDGSRMVSSKSCKKGK